MATIIKVYNRRKCQRRPSENCAFQSFALGRTAEWPIKKTTYTRLKKLWLRHSRLSRLGEKSI